MSTLGSHSDHGQREDPHLFVESLRSSPTRCSALAEARRGPGFTEFGSMTALENWVEKGQLPEKLITGRLSNRVAERSRPIFPYPGSARYSGKGDPKQAGSFVPVDLSQQ